MAVCLAFLQLFSGFPLALAIQDGVRAQGQECVSSGPESGAYSLLLCLVNPLDGTDLNGNITVEGTVVAEFGAFPAIEHVQFYFTREGSEQRSAVLRDYEAPYTFTLPTEQWSDGTYRLEMNALTLDGFETEMSGISLSTSNGVSRIPVSTGRWRPFNIQSNQGIVVGAVGDGAGGMAASEDVANLILGWNPDMFLYLGDVYNIGSYAEFINYYEPTLGSMKAITNPVPGDHEGGRQFQGYLDYWDSSQHYYAVTAGSWRLIMINSTERFDQITPGSIQYEWLEKELQSTNDATCTMVVTHFPRWGQSRHNDYSRLDSLWQLITAENVDVLLSGHEHNYQRWTPMDGAGNPAPDGLTQFVVGTGGHELTIFSSTDPRLASNHQGTFGALRMVLTEGGAEYQYVDTAGTVLDEGVVPCGAQEPSEAVSGPGVFGTIVNTNGLRAMCLAAPDFTSETITLIDEGSRVELLGAPVGGWQPVRCGDREGYVLASLIEADG